MKTKSTNRFVAVALALFMLLMSIPFSMLMTNARAAEAPSTAAEGVYVLNASELPTVKDKGDMATAECNKDGIVTAGTKDYFKIHVDNNTRFDENGKNFEDGFSGTKRINFNSGVNTDSFANSIEFTISNPAAVKVWWVHSKEQRQIVIYNGKGEQAAVSPATTDLADNTMQITKFDLTAAGKYYLGSTPKANYIFKVEITEQVPKTYTLNASELPTVKDKGDMATAECNKDGIVTAGSEDFFKIHVDNNTRFDENGKNFEDGFSGTKRINFNSGVDTSTFVNSVEFTTGSAATVKVWWVHSKEQRQIVIYNSKGEQAAISPKTTDLADNTMQITKFDLPEAGKYYLGSTPKSNYIFKVEVTAGAGKVERTPWADVKAPIITSVALNAEDKGTVDVAVSAVVGNTGGDGVTVYAYDKDGKEVTKKNSLAEKDSHIVSLALDATGTYSFKAAIFREGETDKVSDAQTFDFTLPLGVPTISSVTNKGNGSVTVKWGKVDEATGYIVYAAGKEVKATDTVATVEGLKVGDKVEFTVAAVRGTETGEKSKGITATITAKEQQEWGFTAYGTSVGSSKNKYEGNLNEGKVTIIAQGGAGKLNLAADDGYSFYYTAIPANKNFTFRAKIHVDSWTFSNGQEGFGVAAVDMLPEKAYDTSHWTNFYMAAVGRFTPFNAQQGVGVMAKVGITPENWQAVKDNTFDRTKLYAAAAGEALDDYSDTATSRYNIVGNVTNAKALADKGSTTIAELVDFDLEITKNNTGYFMSYYKDGKLVKTVKHWGTEDLSVLDKDNIYVGIVAARNFTVSLDKDDYTLEIRDPKDDPAPEPKPITYVTPSISIESEAYGNSTSYDLLLKPSHKGTVTIKADGKVIKENMVIGDKLDSDGNIMETILPVTIKPGKTAITVDYKVDETVDLGESVKFKKTTASANVTVDYNDYFAKQDNIYVAPGVKKGNGSKESPYDLATALTLARPGQKIILMEGTYKLTSTIRVPREIDGTKDAMIYLMADPEAKTRPVLDFEGASGIGLQVRGDYWYLQGFDITHASSNGLRIDGNYCVADQIHAYYNKSTGIGIQIDSKFSRLIWPTHNLIKNCDSYYNADPGEEDADGFSAKFCIGVGNVFDNCVAYGNADDGWDLYGRNYPIEPVTIQNCVTYKNGYREDGSRGKGNGNGFKLGGDNNAARHLLINSISFMNGADGITCNSSPNVIVKNSISYKNDKSGISLYTKAGNTDFESAGVISYKNGAGDSFEAKGSQDKTKVDMTYWNGSNGVADDWFKTLEFSGKVARKADGSIDMQGFLELTDKAPANIGATLSGAVSPEITVTPDKEVPDEIKVPDSSPTTGFAPIAIVAIVLAAGVALVVCVIKRKKNV